MIKIKCKVKHGYKRINQTIKKLPAATKIGVEEIIKNTCNYALHLKRGRDEGILFEIIDADKATVKGRIYTDVDRFPWAWFEHFGTGKYAEMPHIGTSKTFIESGYEYWFIPVTQVDQTLHYPIIVIQGKQFYLAHGVPANPFLQQAEFEMRNQNIDVIQKHISNMIKEVCQ